MTVRKKITYWPLPHLGEIESGRSVLVCLQARLDYEVIIILVSCCCSVTQSCLTVCNPMDCNTPSFPVLHHFLELAQTNVQWISDAMQPSHTLSFPSPLSEFCRVMPEKWKSLCNHMDYTLHGILQAKILEGYLFPSPEDLPNPGIELSSPALQANSLPTEPQGKTI